MLLTLLSLALAEEPREPITIPLDEAAEELKRQAPELQSWLQSHPGILLELQVHSDSSGSAAYNQRQTTERAVSLKTQLTDAGVSPSLVVARGLGESQAHTEPGTDPSNRRVVLVFRPE